jgi:antirestriction protein ArdC
MKYFGKAESAAARIVGLFRAGNVPKALAPIFIKRRDGVPCRRWSWSNQLITALHGYSDARGFRQWEQVGRHVKKGERAFYILAPCTRKIQERDGATGDESDRVALYGFRGVAVFGYDQTDGAALPVDTENQQFIDGLPLVSVASTWGLSVETYDGAGARNLGYYRHGQGIALGVENLATWAHELVHAADDRRGTITKRSGQQLDNEVVAELGGAVLLQCLGHDHESDTGGAWKYIERYADKHGKGAHLRLREAAGACL